MKKRTIFSGRPKMAYHPNLFLLLILVALLTAPPLHADRLYHWTDKFGTIHLTQQPPPAEGHLQDVIDYTNESDSNPEEWRDPDLEGIEEYTQTVIGEADDDRKVQQDRALALDNYCYLQAPDIDVYVRVWEPNQYGERDQEIWNGWIQKNQQQKVATQSGRIIYDYQKRPKGPFGGNSTDTCTGGGVLQLLN
jgi:hypothetical protein